jgi:hypothetical protein
MTVLFSGMDRSITSLRVATLSLLGVVMLAGAEQARAEAGDLFATDAVNNSIVVYALDGAARTFATGLDNPQGLVFDQFGNLFVADKGSGNIYMFTADATRTTVATGLADPVGLTFSGMALAVAEQSADLVSRIEGDGSKTTFMSITAPGALNFQLPNFYVLNSTSLISIAPDNSSTIFPLAGGRAVAINNLLDAFVSTDGGDIMRVAPDGTQGVFASGITDPNGLAFRPKRYSDTEDGVGNLFVADTSEGMIREFTPNGMESTFATGFSPNFLAFELILPGQLLNISTRLRALTGDNVLIGGFIVAGDAPKKVLLRAIGPSLGDLDPPLTGVLADPILELHLPDGTVQTNDDWRSDQEMEIEDTELEPESDLESALVTTLDPGAYTVIVRGKDDGVGIAMVEAYDLDQTSSELANISTRGFVDAGDNILIGGFIIDPAESARVIVRAIGPSLADSNVPDPLQDPILELHDGNGDTIKMNDDWAESAEGEIEASGLAPHDARESSILANLMGGNYTAIVRGMDDTVGVALVEIYHLP